MKKPFSRRVVRRVTGNLFLLAASVLVLVYSCKKDITPSQTTIPLNETAQSAAVKEAKSWFDTNAKINKQPSKTTNALNQQKWNDGLNLDWNKPDVYGKYNGTLVELPLVNSSVVFAFDRTNANGITQQNNYTKTSFIVQKDSSGVFRGWYMVLIADTTYVSGNFDRLKLNTYKSRDKDFSGRLLYYTPQGDFLAGWRYEKGVITKTISVASGVNSDVGSKRINAKQEINVARICFDRPVVTTTASCFTDPNTGMYDCTYTYTTTYLTECYDVPDGGGGGGGSGGGGSGGGGTTFPPPPTPKPDCPPVAVASAKGPQVNVAEGGGGGGGTNPCTPVPQEDPCAKAKKLASNSAFNSKMNDLKSKVSQPMEYAYLIKGQNTVFESLQGGANGVNFNFNASFFNQSDGFIHSHEANAGNLSIFSPPDLQALYIAVSSGNVNNQANFTFGLVTSSGSYLLSINDLNKFLVMGANNLAPNNPNQFNAFNFLFNNYVNTNNSAQQNEANFATFLNTFGGGMGLSLLKADANLTGYNAILVNEDGSITLLKCN